MMKLFEQALQAILILVKWIIALLGTMLAIILKLAE